MRYAICDVIYGGKTLCYRCCYFKHWYGYSSLYCVFFSQEFGASDGRHLVTILVRFEPNLQPHIIHRLSCFRVRA